MRRNKTLNPGQTRCFDHRFSPTGPGLVDFSSNDWSGRDMDAGISRLPGA
jgi:hypothetical protein